MSPNTPPDEIRDTIHACGGCDEEIDGNKCPECGHEPAPWEP